MLNPTHTIAHFATLAKKMGVRGAKIPRRARKLSETCPLASTGPSQVHGSTRRVGQVLSTCRSPNRELGERQRRLCWLGWSRDLGRDPP